MFYCDISEGVDVARSRDACLLSILKLARDAGAAETYLHTLTFADPEPGQKEAQRRWANLRTSLKRQGKKGVWVIQRGGRTNRLHFHVVTVDRWDAGAMWAMLPRYGFGRYDVRPPRPVEFAAYVAKYIGRAIGLLPNSRTFGVFGFTGVRTCDVRTGEIVVDRVAELPFWVVSQMARTSLGDDKFSHRKNFIERRFSQAISNQKQMNEVKPHQVEEIVRDCQAGLYAVCVGEYRGFTVNAGKKLDKVSGVEKHTVRVEHSVFCGTEKVLFVEFLPPGADGDAVKPSAAPGDMVICRVTEWKRSTQTGQITARGHIKPLIALPLRSPAKS